MDPIEWRTSGERVDYAAAVAEMEARVQAIRAGTASELVWLLEHPPLYSAGTSARADRRYTGLHFRDRRGVVDALGAGAPLDRVHAA